MALDLDLDLALDLALDLDLERETGPAHRRRPSSFQPAMVASPDPHPAKP